MSARLEELLWKRQDGDLSAEERAWLEGRLAADPEARREAELITQLSAMLEELPEKEPPPELDARIEAALAESAARRRSVEAARWKSEAGGASKEGGVRGPEGGVRGPQGGVQGTAGGVQGTAGGVRGPGGSVWVPGAGPGRRSSDGDLGPLPAIFGASWRLALACLVTGLVLGALVYHGMQRLRGPWTTQEMQETWGAMAGPAEAALDVPLAGEAGSLALWRRGSTLLVDLTLRTAPVDLAIGGGGGVSLLALSHDSSTPPDLQHRDSTLRVIGLGRGRLVLSAGVADPAMPLQIEVSSAGGALGQATFRLADLDEPSGDATNFLPR